MLFRLIRKLKTRATSIKKAAWFVLLFIACSATTEVALGGDPKGKTPAKGKAPNYARWNGVWLLNCKYEDKITSVIATVERSNTISFAFRTGDGQCTVGSDAPKSRDPFLKASISSGLGLSTYNDKPHLYTGTTVIIGKIHFCTDDKTLADAKNLSAVFECGFEGEFDDATDTITGHAKGEYWSWPEGHPEQAARKPEKDPVIEVTLRLKRGKGAQPQAPPDTSLPTPTPDWRGPINNPMINGINGVVAGERNKNRPSDANSTPTPDTFPLLGIQDTVDNIAKDLSWLFNGAPKNPSTPPSQQH